MRLIPQTLLLVAWFIPMWSAAEVVRIVAITTQEELDHCILDRSILIVGADATVGYKEVEKEALAAALEKLEGMFSSMKRHNVEPSYTIEFDGFFTPDLELRKLGSR